MRFRLRSRALDVVLNGEATVGGRQTRQGRTVDNLNSTRPNSVDGVPARTQSPPGCQGARPRRRTASATIHPWLASHLSRPGTSVAIAQTRLQRHKSSLQRTIGPVSEECGRVVLPRGGVRGTLTPFAGMQPDTNPRRTWLTFTQLDYAPDGAGSLSLNPRVNAPIKDERG